MKKILLLSLPLIIVSAFLLLPARALAATYYVSPTGSDSNAGTSSTAPWQTLTKVNAKAFAAGDQVLFQAGGTWVGSLVPATAGTAAAPITFSSYGTGTKPVITGFAALSGWTALGNGIYGATCTSCGSTVNMVTLNGSEVAMGRYPNVDAGNAGYLTYQSGTTTSITSSSIGATNWTGATVVERVNHFVMGAYPITSQSGTTINHANNTSSTPNANFGFFIENDPRTLDEIGEWYYNPTTKQLQMYFGANGPTGYAVQAATVPTLATLAHSYITVNGLSFQGSMTDGIIPTGTGITVQNTDIGFSGTNAIDLNNAASFTLRNSTISNTNNIGIYFSYVGSNKNDSIIANAITNTGVIPGMAGPSGQYVGILMVEWTDSNNDIEQNTITNTGYNGISFSDDGTIIKNNVVNTFCTLLDDGGGIYTWNSPTNSSGVVTPVVHPTQRQVVGNIVLNGVGAPLGANSTTYLPAEGIYMDQLTDNVLVSGNTIANMPDAGLFMNSPQNITVTNNTSYNNGLRQSWVQANPVPKITYTGNKLISPTVSKGDGAFSTDPGGTTVAGFGTLDTNYYAHNSAMTSILGTVYGNASYTLPQWQTAFNQDLHSKDVSITNGTAYQFFYNPTNASAVQTLAAGTYTDVTGALYSGSITLPAYGSVVLVPNGTATITGSSTGGDTTPPTVSMTAPTAGATVSGSTVALTATASDNVGVANVQFKVDGTAVGAALTLAPFTYSWNSATVANGTHTITATAKDAAGNTTTSSSVSVTVNNTVADTTPPTVSITAPAAGATLSGATVALTATAADNVGVASVQFKVDGTAVGSLITAAPYTYTLNTTTLTNATHSITATAKDAAGNTTTSAAISVTVDNAAPTISGITVSSITATTATVAWTTNKAATSQMDYGTTTAYGTTTTFNSTQSTSHSIALTGLTPNTSYHFDVKSIAANNMLTTSADQIFTTATAPDTTPPTVSISAPAAGATVSGSAVALTASASDNVAVASVQFQIDGVLVGTPITIAPYTYTWNTTTATSGSHTITAIAKDSAGNSATATTITVTVSNTVTYYIAASGLATNTGTSAASPWPISKLSTATINPGTSILFNRGDTFNNTALVFTHSGSAGSPITFDVYGTGVNPILSGGGLANPVISISNQSYITINNLVIESSTSQSGGLYLNTDHDITVHNNFFANVAAGMNAVLCGNNIVFDGNYGYDMQGPFPRGEMVQFNNVNGTGEAITNNRLQNILGQSNPEDGISVYQSNGTAASPIMISGNWVEGGGPSTSGVGINLGDGGNSSYVTATNNIVVNSGHGGMAVSGGNNMVISNNQIYGAQNTWTGVGIQVNNYYTTTSACSAITVSNNQVNWTSSTGAASPSWNSGNCGTITGWSTNNFASTITATILANPLWAASLWPLPVGSGDTTVPTITLTAPASGSTVSGSTIAISATASDNTAVASVQFKVDSTLIGTSTVAPYTATWNSTTATNGSHVIIATATDTSGNIGTATAGVTVNNVPADTTPPTVSISTPTAGATVYGTTTITAAASDNVAVANVQILIDGTVVASALTTAPYTYTWNTTTATNATHSITAIAKDTAGNTTTSSAVSVTVDNAGPVISAIGASGITSSGATIAWTTNKIASSQVGYGTTTAYGTTTTFNGTQATSHSVALTGLLPSTVYHYAVMSISANNVLTTSTDQTFTTAAAADTTAPTVSFTTPVAGATVSGSAVTITATATDNVGVKNVQFYLNGVAIGPLLTTAPYTYVWDTTTATTGAVTLGVHATDAAGNVGGGQDAITVDNTPPGRVSPAPSGTLTAGTTSTTLSLTTTEAAVCRYSTVANTAYASMTNTFAVTGGTSQSTPVSGLTNGGSYTYYIRCIDNYGNADTGDVPLAFSVALPADTTPPTVSITTPATGSTVFGSSITLTATAADNVGVVNVQILVDGTVVASALTTSPYTSVLNTTTLTNGTHAITAIARDAAGNSTTSSAVSITVDNAGPVISAIGASGITSSAATINWTTDKAATSQMVYGLTSTYGTTTTFNGTQSTSHSIALTGLSPSTTYHYAVESISANNILTTSADQTFTTAAAPDTLPPTVSITAPTAGTTLSGTISLTATATDNVGITSVQFQVDSALVGSPITSAPYTYTWNTATATNGTHTITAIAKDAAGNVGTAITVTVTVDNAGPVISAINASGITSSAATINWTTDKVATSQVVYGTTTAYGTTTTFNSTQSTSHSVALAGLLLPNTVYHYVVQSIAANNILTASPDQTFTTSAVADTTPPVVALTSPTVNAVLVGSSVVLNATATDNVGVKSVQFYLDSTAIGPVLTAAPYTYTWDSTTIPSPSPRTIKVQAIDAAGNVATAQAAIEIDNNPPGRSSLLPTGTLPAGTTSTTISVVTTDAATCRYDLSSTTPYASMANTFAVTGGTTHSSVVTGLIDNSANHFYVACADAFGVADAGSVPIFFSIASATVNNTAPAISTIGGTTSAHSATITWTTDQPSDSQVEYGTTTGYGSLSVLNSTLTTTHSVVISNLMASTTYHFAVESTANGLQTISPDKTFATTRFSRHGTIAVSSFRVTAGQFMVRAAADITPPTVTLTAPPSGATVNGLVSLTASANDDVGVSSVQFTINDVVVAEPTTVPYTFTWDSTNVPNGSYTIAAIAYDATGNATITPAITVTVSNPPPVLFGQTASVITSSGGGGGGGGGGGAVTLPTTPSTNPSTSSGSTSSTSTTIPNGCTAAIAFSPVTGQQCPNYSSSGSGSGITLTLLTKVLSLGVRDVQVQILQHVLNSNGFAVALSGIGSLGNESTYFGPATKAAVKRFQAANAITTTGTTGPITRAAINRLLGGGSATISTPTVTVQHVTVTAVNANVRTAGSLSGTIITTVPHGTIGTLITNAGSWLNVSFTGGASGWVAKSAVTIY